MEITIDGLNIYTQWKLTPALDGVYSQLMQQPDIKDRVSNSWTDVDGDEVLIEPAKIKSRQINLTFQCESYSNYKAFISYLIAHPIVVLWLDESGEEYYLEYKACSSYNHYKEYDVFAVRFNEPNPLNKGI